jgi:polysaccharide biosynthesis/export protein
MQILLKTLLVFVVFIAFSGCVSHKQLLNFQEKFPALTQTAMTKMPDIRIQPNDVLGIKVYSTDMDLVVPFNISSPQQNDGYVNIESILLSGFLVDKEGKIDFPVLGRVELKGLSIAEAKDLFLEKLKPYLKDPVVNIRLLNFKVTVSGEVHRPGGFNVFNDRISLLDALALAGDLTDYADRRDVLLVREVDGIQFLNKINLQTAEFFQSDYYYLKQNDLIYVKPIKAKSGAIQDRSSKSAPILSAVATVVAVFIAIFKN